MRNSQNGLFTCAVVIVKRPKINTCRTETKTRVAVQNCHTRHLELNRCRIHASVIQTVHAAFAI